MRIRKYYFAVFTSAVLIATGSVTAHAQAPTDPQIAGIVQTANQIDINQAKLALKRTSNPQVKKIRQPDDFRSHQPGKVGK
jgi:putative membrane protein